MARRELEEAISHEVLPRLVVLPDQLRVARAAVEDGAPNGLEALVADTNSALEELRELTRGVFPTQLARTGIEPAVRSHLARTDPAPTLHVDDSAASLRFPERVETAVYFCCVEATRLGPSTMATLDRRHRPGAGGERARGSPPADLQPVLDRVEAVGGTLSQADGVLELRIPVDQEAGGGPALRAVGPGPSAALAT